jgi:hypothetical protein
MSDSSDAGQVAELRRTVFHAVRDWNTAHPQPLRSHRERATINITHTSTDANETPKYTIAIECQLAGRPSLTFHGHELGAVAEQARLTVGHRIAVELQLREENAREVAELIGKYGVVVADFGQPRQNDS